jgi:hypothetical protein
VTVVDIHLKHLEWDCKQSQQSGWCECMCVQAEA